PLEDFLGPPKVLNDPLMNASNQVLIVENLPGPVFKGRVTAWERENQQWKIFGIMNAVVGRNGIAVKDEKREGDGKTPSGAFLLKTVFGYDQKIDTKMNYRQATPEDVWIDDVHSKNYNHWENIKDAQDAKSFEKMKRDDDLYQAGVVIE